MMMGMMTTMMVESNDFEVEYIYLELENCNFDIDNIDCQFESPHTECKIIDFDIENLDL